MTWHTEKTEQGKDLVWDAVEQGIAPSPLKGTANIQNANISTETGEVLASFGRISQTPTNITGGTLTPNGASLLTPSNTALSAGQWIKVTASTITSITAATNPTTAAISYLLVGGGGAGGGADAQTVGGGGGAGQVIDTTGTVSIGTYLVTIGAGGVGSSSTTVQNNGSSSIIAGIATAVGGGAGGTGLTAKVNGANGASGGGGGGNSTPTLGTNGTATAGNDGGDCDGGVNNQAGGGGGGAGATGGNGVVGTTASAGAGGNGTASSVSGASVQYGGGGGGGGETHGGPVGGSTGGLGGDGGGGNGGLTGSTGGAAGSSGSANTGGGGGGAGNASGAAVAGGSGGSGIAIISYNTGALLATGGTVTVIGSKTIHTFTATDTFNVYGIAQDGWYYVDYKNTSNDIKLSTKFDPTGANAISHGTTGTATFDVIAVPNSAIAKSTEIYHTATGTEYRYYVLDANGYVWVYDTAVYASSLAASGVGTKWMLPDATDTSDLGFTGLAVLNGFVLSVANAHIYGKSTENLGGGWDQLTNIVLNDPFPTHTNFAYVGHQGKMYYCDSNYIGEIFPTTSLVTSIGNIQSYCSYTGSSTTGTITAVINGSIPYSPDGTRIPVVFFTDVYGTLPTAITGGTVYYIDYDPVPDTFVVYTAITGGSTVNIETGAVGNQYFNTFYPTSTAAGNGGSTPLMTATTQRVNLPFEETAQCLVEIGNNILIGCAGNIVYPWNQIDATPSDFIALPESNTTTMVNVNNMAYIFAGNKGNIYISNGSIASLALKVPDYCAGVPGTPSTYIEPYFTWGDSMYLRGRVYFSILDQTATKAGNCGGVWSFVPTQNMYLGQDIGTALRLENQNSYATYNGYSTILIPAQDQAAISPQYWSWWQDSYSTGTSNFGVDFTNTIPVTTFIVETDLLATGTILSKDTYTQLEYKLSTQLTSGESVQLYWRLNSTDAWTSAGTVIQETNDLIAGYFDMNWQKSQWVQFRAVCTTTGDATSSFVRLRNIMFRQ